MGNLACSGAIGSIGSSVKGWSNVGVGMAEALHEELDELLANVTAQLTDAINRTMETQDMIDGMLSSMGSTAMSSSALAVTHIALMQTDGELIGDPFSQIMDFVSKALGQLPSFQTGLAALQQMLINLKPALEQVGIWVESFADKVQATVETFGTTMDRVQKIFDQMMSKMSADAGANADEMQHETFNLFDTDGDGAISEEDLVACAELYAVPALKGEKAQSLIETYDADGDGSISFDSTGEQSEFGLLVEDPSIVGIMATVLRAYAKRLSMVAGNVGAAHMRDEVAINVVKYFQLVCSKNLTKVGWISDMLTNATLPMPFTADVMIELALQKDDPDVLTKADVGQMVVGMMMTVNSDYTSEAFDLLSTAEHFTSEGYDEEDQAGVVQQITEWMQSGPDAIAEAKEKMVVAAERTHDLPLFPDADEHNNRHPHSHPKKDTHAERNGLRKDHQNSEHDRHHKGASLLEEAQQESTEEAEELSMPEKRMLDVLDMMPRVANRMARERMEQHRLTRWRDRAKKRLDRFDTEASRVLLENLMHGQAASEGGAADLAEQALSRGVQAKPETLLFAQWLKANATTTADGFQNECMSYTGESSGPLDAFNTQVQGMVKKISGFINMMKKYASPTGIQHIEDMIDEFAAMGMHDIFKIVGAKIVDVLSASADGALQGALGDANSTDAAADDNASDANESLVHKRKHSLLETSSQLSQGLSLRRLSRSHLQKSATMFQDLGHPHRHVAALHKHKPVPRSERLKRAEPYLQMWGTHSNVMLKQPEGGGGGGLSGVWEQVGNLLREMEKILPTSIELLKFARTEVSAVASNLDSIFGMLGGKGQAIFVTIADLYAEIWGAYFFFVFSMTFGILVYGFWASGWGGGPQPLPKTLDPYEPPKTFIDRVSCCWSACCRCCVQCHDTQSCFWSFIILFQVIVLLLFIISIVFCILAGIQMFMGSSCMQLYIITDTKVCTQSLDQFATFLSTFRVGEGEVPLSMACDHHELLTCDLIHDKMFQAGIMTVAGSFLSVVFSFELIFAIAIIHERARWRRVINEIEQDNLDEEADKDKVAKESAEKSELYAAEMAAREAAAKKEAKENAAREAAAKKAAEEKAAQKKAAEEKAAKESAEKAEKEAAEEAAK